MKLNKLILLLTTLLLALPACGQSVDNETLLDSLDQMIARQESFVEQKEADIRELRKRFRYQTNEEESYALRSMLYDEYYVYDADSAMNLAKANLQQAKMWGKPDMEAEWNIKVSFVYAATGLLEAAERQLVGVDEKSLPRDLKVEFFRQRIYILSHYIQYASGNVEQAKRYQGEEAALKDSICDLVSKEDRLYMWQKAWGPKPSVVKEQLIREMAKSELDSRFDAMNAYCLSHIYEIEGNMEEKVHYLIISAMADVRSCNRDIASLEELAKWLFSQGDIDHSYKYINYCLQMDRLYHNRVHMVSLSEVLNDIHDAYRLRLEEQQNRLYMLLVVVSVLVLLLVVLIVALLLGNRRLRASRADSREANAELKHNNAELDEMRADLSEANSKLSEANDKLSDLNQQLTEANGRLRDANYVKEEIIGYVFSICSQYISRMEEFRKRVSRQLKTGQTEELKQTIEKPMQQAELKDFLVTFDQVFLNIYPDFVQDFNALLRPEERITLKEGELLNTELRIYALVRLGINDSVKISEFLHCSAQTVYNNRLRCRNKAIGPKEDFARTVMELGKTPVDGSQV